MPLSKQEIHQQELLALFRDLVTVGDGARLREYLATFSELPGRRANLELAWAYGELVELYARQIPDRLWAFCADLTALSPPEAPVDSPEEYLPFCGAIGLGSLGAAMPEYFEEALAVLKRLAADSRWRMREAVCFGLQRLLKKRPYEVLNVLQTWIGNEGVFQQRAALTALAAPELLADEALAHQALELHKCVVDRIPHMGDIPAADFRVLRKALGYTVSVVISAIPEEGFKWLMAIAASSNRDVRWIVKENLKKNRLVQSFPKEVEAIKLVLFKERDD